MAHIEIYAKDWCPFCHRAKSLFADKGVDYVEHDVTHNLALEQEMHERSARSSVPQIFIDGEHVGGYTDLNALEISGWLDEKLSIDKEAAPAL